MKKQLTALFVLVCGVMAMPLALASIYIGMVPPKWEKQYFEGRGMRKPPGHQSKDEPFILVVKDGSLKDNVQRALTENGWNKLVWKIPYDYQWIGETRIVAGSLQDALSKLLADYPVQAIFYESNHVVSVVPRNQKGRRIGT